MIKLTDHQIKILGRPNFACGQPAKLLIANRLYEDRNKKAEYEQAVFIHWALELLNTYGDDWKKEADKILNNCAENLTASSQP